MTEALRLGTRGSSLALWQANHVRDRLLSAHPDLEVDVVVVRTGGDRRRSVPLSQSGGIGFFTKEIEEALLSGEVDVAVHSLKDLPTELSEGLRLAAVPQREDPREALFGRPGVVDGVADLPGRTLGTSSPRRRGQLLAAFPELSVVPIRGNVETRIRRTREEGGLDATVLAVAGVKRLGLLGDATEVLAETLLLPAPGQGALGLEVREDDARALELLNALDDEESRARVAAERAFLSRLAGGCTLPAGALAERCEGGDLVLSGVVADPDGAEIFRAEFHGDFDAPEDLGRRVADAVVEKGAGELLSRLAGDAP